MRPHKNERVLQKEEANAKNRYSEFTICHCTIDDDHKHFLSKYSWQQADVKSRMKRFEEGKPPLKTTIYPYYYQDLPTWNEPKEQTNE